MLVTTAHAVEGRRIVAYHGVVSGEAIFGANVFRDWFASIRDVVGGRSGAYEKVLRSGRDTGSNPQSRLNPNREQTAWGTRSLKLDSLQRSREPGHLRPARGH